MPTKFFKKPFTIAGHFIKDINKNICFTLVCNDDLAYKIVDKLNGRSTEHFNARIKMDNILIDDVIVLKINHFGYLNNFSTCSYDKIRNEQDKLLAYVITKLKE